LTENRHAVTGSYSLQAHVTGRGPVEKVAQTLRGQFEFNAQDGQLAQSPNTNTPLEATFDFLNRTGHFDVAFPDLDRESFPFRSISIRGYVEGLALVKDEFIIQSSLATITGNGKIDLEHQQIELEAMSVRMQGRDRQTHTHFRLYSHPPLYLEFRCQPALNNLVSYLSPADVGAQLLSIPMKVFGLPLEAIRLFTPNVLQWGNK
jgi:hypothetical protein